jgi:predicted TIM-barrel fold metal-dependent hydrolase
MGQDMNADQRKEVFNAWRTALAETARHQNIICKVGGLGMPFWGLGLELRTEPIGYLEVASIWKPYIETSIELFGANRCMMESNFPPDARACGYVPLWNAFKHIVSDASRDEKAALFHGTAARVYRIDLHGAATPAK